MIRFNSPLNVIKTQEGQRLQSPGAYPLWLVKHVSIVFSSDEHNKLLSALEKEKVCDEDASKNNGAGDELSSMKNCCFSKTFSSPSSSISSRLLSIPTPPPFVGSFHSIRTIAKLNKAIPSHRQQLLKIVWDDSQSTVHYFDLEWLQRWRYDSYALNRRRRYTEVTPKETFMYRRKILLESEDISCTCTNPSSEELTPSCTSNRSEDNRRDNGVDDYGGLVSVDYHKLERELQDCKDGKDDELFFLLDSVFQDGAAIIKNAPAITGGPTAPLVVLGKAIAGSLSHTTLYGEIFHVKSVPDAENIAYTSLKICPHQDLAYYESKPGLQLLHCISGSGQGENGEGESTLIDALAAAYEFRSLAPDMFKVLTRCPATFVKENENALCMSFTRPHIVLKEGRPLEDTGSGEENEKYLKYLNNDINREIVAVNWSPPFEGPVSMIPADQIQNYYKAYGMFEKMLDDSILLKKVKEREDKMKSNDRVESCLSGCIDNKFSAYARDFTFEYKLKPGEILVFNNCRMLHGRRSFSLASDNERHLVGAYTNMEDSLNKYRVLLNHRRDISLSKTQWIPNVGNGSIIQ